MKLLEMLADFFLCPVETIIEWLDNLVLDLGIWWSELLKNIGIGVATTIVEGVAISVVCYAAYCACRVMCSGGNDEKFSEYINKSMLAALGYFFARCGGNIILGYLGVM